MKGLIFILVSLSFTPTLSAQTNLQLIGAWSRSLPPPSPVLSTSMDDIPPTPTNIVTADGSYVLGRANFMLSYMDVSPLEQKVWFTLSADGAPANVYYNERTRVSTASPWYWSFSRSYPVQEVYENTDWNRNPSYALGTVLHDPSSRFRNPVTGARFSYLMYTIYQPSSCDGLVTGFLVLSFSNDGKSWIGPYQVIRENGPVFGCWPGHVSTVPVFAVSAIYDGSYTVHLMGVEGDASLLIDRSNMDRTFAVTGFADINSLGLVRLRPGAIEASSSGVVKPQSERRPSCAARYSTQFGHG